jgi:hypothetical protein
MAFNRRTPAVLAAAAVSSAAVSCKTRLSSSKWVAA